MKNIKLKWTSSGVNKPMKTCYARVSGLTFVVQEYIHGASLEVLLDTGHYPDVYEAMRGAQSILNEIIRTAEEVEK